MNQRLEILLPLPLRGSGGHRTAIAAGESLAMAGHDVHIHFQRATSGTPESEIQDQAVQWHGARQVQVHAGWPDRFDQAAAVIATTWQSASHLAAVATDTLRMHFVQDYEAWFHPVGDESVAAKGVHDLGLTSVVIGEWLRHKLWADHRLPTWTVPFTADLQLYRGFDERKREPLTVLAMYQPEKPRRCGQLMADTLRLVLQHRPEVRILTVGSELSPRLGPRHRHLGLVPKEDLPELYGASSVGFSISASNPSRVPFEMMATGLPVVEYGAQNTVYDLPEQACVLAHPDPRSMSSAILDLLDDEARLTELGAAGAAFMNDRSSDREGAAFVAAVQAALAGQRPDQELGGPRYGRPIHRLEPLQPWWRASTSEVDGVFGFELADQLRANRDLNRVNDELNRVNQELNRANEALSESSEQLHDVNVALNADNQELNRVNHELAAQMDSLRRARSRTLRARIRRRTGKE